MDSIPSNSHGNLDEQIAQLMQCKPLSEQEVVKGTETQNVIKVPGCSLIELDGLVHEFAAGDKSQILEETILLSISFNKHFKSIWFEDNATERY